MWRSVKNSVPSPGIRVKVKHEITGIGAPEREGWTSTGFYTKSKKWSVSKSESLTSLDKLVNQPVTHWDYDTRKNKRFN
jgi:hypothetical protein